MMRRLMHLALLGAVGCGRGTEEEADVVPRVPVGVTVVASDTLTDAVSVIGRLTPPPGGSAILNAPTAGLVTRVAVQVGARVRAGDLLVDLSAPDLQQNARGLAAAADAAEKDARRQQDLLAEGLTSQRQAEQRTAEAVAARAQATAAAEMLSRARVRSPIAGGVQRVMVHPGERIDAGAELAEVINSTRLDLIAAVPAKDLERLRVGQEALVTMDGAATGRSGAVLAISPAVDSLTNAAQVVIRLTNADGSLKAGSGATALISVARQRQTVVIPDSALVVVGDSLTVFVVEGDTLARARTVLVGARRGGRAEIRSGLRAGEQLVVSGAFGLVDGMRVTPAKPPVP